MLRMVVVFFLLPILVVCYGYSNIHLLEEEVATALKVCSYIDNRNGSKGGSRQKRYVYKQTRIDADTREDSNPYNHIRRNTTQLPTQIHVLNASDYDYLGNGANNEREKFINSVPRPALGKENKSNTNYKLNERTRRNVPLLNKNDIDQCISQCVFANLQVVDSHGIPREAELWNKLQTSVTSQQSRVLLRDQIRACFQKLQSESEENGCSYSNKLERCLMLGFSNTNGTETNSS